MGFRHSSISLFCRYLYHVGTMMSLCTVIMFQVERLQVLRSPIGRQEAIKNMCRRCFAVLCAGIWLEVLPVLALYELDVPGSATRCFFAFPGSVPPLTVLYLASVLLYGLLPLTALPALSAALVLTVRRWSRATLLLGLQPVLRRPRLDSDPSLATNQKPESQKRVRLRHRGEVKAALNVTLVSLYTSLCLSPNLLWIGLVFSEPHLHSNSPFTLIDSGSWITIYTRVLNFHVSVCTMPI